MEGLRSGLDGLMSEALALHHAGKVREARERWEAAHRLDPDNADVLHFLGVCHGQENDRAGAIELIRRAIDTKKTPQFCSNLGLMLHQSGQVEQAAAAFRDALALEPDYFIGHNNLGIALRDLGNRAEAKRSFREALRLNPQYADAWDNLGVCHRAEGSPAEAEACFRAALRVDSQHGDAQLHLGDLLLQDGRADEAEAQFREALNLDANDPTRHLKLANALAQRKDFAGAERHCREAVRLDPKSVAGWLDLGNVLKELKRYVEAEACCREAASLAPNSPVIQERLASALQELGRFSEAEARYRHAIRMSPGFAAAQGNLGILLTIAGRPDEGEEYLREAICLQPDLAEAHFNLAWTLLRTGRYEEGWREYEWRWKTAFFQPMDRKFLQPMWGGEPLDGRTLLIHAEQGYGDNIQFCRYIPLIDAPGNVVFEAPPALLKLFRSLPGVSRLIPRGKTLPAFDLHCPIMSLPHVFGTTLETIPAGVPYLAADPRRVAKWRERLASVEGRRVGLVWAGNWGRGDDRWRSITLDRLAPLGGVDGVSLVSLQKGPPAEQTRYPPPGMAIHDWTDDLHDFADTAALIAALDLVIGVDTAVSHLAGALGRPIWVVNRFDSCWRYLMDRPDTPWYPTMRQFRQPRLADWDDVIGQVRRALTEYATAAPRRLRPP
jgi:Flp pilus assembly protein TadD